MVKFPLISVILIGCTVTYRRSVTVLLGCSTVYQITPCDTTMVQSVLCLIYDERNFFTYNSLTL
ncbi:hypothetical protein KM1_317840 [Entamoeba histolytica HM-3:IMSS]|uniref:Secreted protein n=1 Tax=Entamoeba histolytica HM-3:IMSS TaxID=885315 RepID=M7WFE3_ENTHI|nr:hypothetical protein KM1_317840 [Entamoeba histolytica HM-3:IMSS]